MHRARPALLLALAPLLAAVSDCETPRALPVTTLGDSITWGYVPEPGGPGYPALLDALPLFDVRNLAVPGALASTWSDLLVFFAAAADLDFEGEIVTLMIGTNDAELHVPEDEYLAHVDFSAGFALALGAEWVVLMSPPPPPASADDPLQRELLHAYRDGLLGICALRARVVCRPDVFALLDPRRHLPPSDKHPNAEGHERIAQGLGPVLVQLGFGRGERAGGGGDG